MSDLISRKALLGMLKYNRELHEDENGETRQLVAVDINRLIEYVEKMPDALEPILEGLEEEKRDAQMRTGIYETNDDYYLGQAEALNLALERLRGEPTT